MTTTKTGTNQRDVARRLMKAVGTANSHGAPIRATVARRLSADFPPNGYGLFDMAGNVWEWTTDWYAANRDDGGCCVAASYDPAQPQFRIPRKIIKGGSYLCADSYCQRYRPAGRRPHMIDTGMSHIGFRCIVRPR